MSRFSPIKDAGALPSAPLVCALEMSGIALEEAIKGRDLLREVEAVAGAFDLTWVGSKKGKDRSGWSIHDAGIEDSPRGKKYWMHVDISQSIRNGRRVPLRAVFLCLDIARKRLELFSAEIAPQWGRGLLSGFLNVRTGEREWPFPKNRWDSFESYPCNFAEVSGGIAFNDLNLAAWTIALLEAAAACDATATATHRIIELDRT